MNSHCGAPPPSPSPRVSSPHCWTSIISLRGDGCAATRVRSLAGKRVIAALRCLARHTVTQLRRAALPPTLSGSGGLGVTSTTFLVPLLRPFPSKTRVPHVV